MKNILGILFLALVLAFLFIFAIDAELARADRAEYNHQSSCIFSINCK